jgi:hypothetical protein
MDYENITMYFDERIPGFMWICQDGRYYCQWCSSNKTMRGHDVRILFNRLEHGIGISCIAGFEYKREILHNHSQDFNHDYLQYLLLED